MNALLAALVNGAVASALVTAVVWLGLLAIPRRTLNAATRYVVWWAALAIAAVLPAWYLPHRMAPPHSQAVYRTPLAPSEVTRIEGPAPRAIGTPAQVPAPARGLRFPLAIPAGRWPPRIIGAWMLLTSVMLLRLAVSCLALARRKALAREAPPHLAARLETWLTQCGSARGRVRLAASPGIPTPVAAGLRRPAILLPPALLEQLEEGDLDRIGLHEAAHLARRDDYALILERLLEALFALHPVVRWIARRIDLEREIACDDFVVQATGSPRPYAACLTRVAELTGGVRSSRVAAAAADERSHLTRRVDMLLDKTRHTGTRLLKTRLAATVAALAALSFFAARTPGLIAFATPQPAAAAVAPVPGPRPPAPPPQPAHPAAKPAPAPSAPPEPPAADVAAPSPVGVTLAVEDPMHRFVTGLEKDNFRIFEDDVEQQIFRFSSDDVPVSVGLVLDASGSMRTKFQGVEQAVLQFLRTANPADELFVINFNQEAQLASGFTRSHEEIENRLAQIHPSGGTALWDAIFLAVEHLQEAHNPQQAILVITDTGGDNSSSHSYSDVENLLRRTKWPVYTIGIGGPDAESSPLSVLNKQIGGRPVVVESLDMLPAALARIGAEMRNQYMIEYTPRTARQVGRYYRLRIELAPPPGLPPLTVRHRSGYYAPEH